MTLKERINEDFKTALKAGMKSKKDCLAMLKTKIMEVEKSEKNAGKELTDAEVLNIVSSYNKQLQQTIDAMKANPNHLVAQAMLEQEFISVYLPAQMNEDEIRSEVKLIFGGGFDRSNKGKATGLAMQHFKLNYDGRYNPGNLKKIVDEVLSSNEFLP